MNTIYGQKYEHGIVIQRSSEGSAFQEIVTAQISEEGTVDATLPGGMKKVNVATSIEAGAPVVVTELPTAGEDYEGLVYKVGNDIYLCEETTTDTFEWIKQVDNNSQLGYPLVYESVDELPEPGPAHSGQFAQIDGMVLHFYYCTRNESDQWEWREMVAVPAE